MPYKWIKEHKKLPESLDRRRKILSSEHIIIIARHKAGEAIRAIARAYKVDKRTIHFIIFPERLEINKQNHKKRQESKKQYAKVRGKRWAEIVREHRHYKQLNKNKLI